MDTNEKWAILKAYLAKADSDKDASTSVLKAMLEIDADPERFMKANKITLEK